MKPRTGALDLLRRETFDVLILGGGINGAGAARDLALRSRDAGRDLKIALVEQEGFASGSSSRSSPIIRGSLRYLEDSEHLRVRESQRESGILLETAPHLVQPQPFLLPLYGAGMRLRYGLALSAHDVFAGARSTARHRSLSRAGTLDAEPELAPRGLSGGAIFCDARIRPARFVLDLLQDADRLGAACANYVRAGTPELVEGLWKVPLTDTLSGDSFTTQSRRIINATGAWQTGLRRIRGSHLVYPRLLAGPQALAWCGPDGRIVCFLPWGDNGSLTLVGASAVEHAVVKKIVQSLRDSSGNEYRSLDDLKLIELKRFSPLFEKDVFAVLSPREVAEARNSYGGTGKKALETQIRNLKKILQ